jgi:hypothetical protein
MKIALLISLLLIGYVLYVSNQSVPRCGFINGREIVTGHCIPYCPPDPKECE